MLLILTLLLFLPAPSGDQTLPDGFVYAVDIIPDLKVDLRYFSDDNFVGEPITGYKANKLILSEQAALALLQVQQYLRKRQLGLKVFDAYRPQQAVDHFVRWAADLGDTLTRRKYYPEVDKSRLFDEGYISSRSGHSRGSTVDLTLVYLTGPNAGSELDMGTGWDYFGPESWPDFNRLEAQQLENRMILRTAMTENGFRSIKTEWWHFTLENEPFPDSYFDFPVR